MATKPKPSNPNVVIPPIDDEDETPPQTINDQDPLAAIEKEIAEAKKNGAKRIRYSDEQKEVILKWIEDYDSENGRGGASKVADKLGISPISISQWKKAEGGETTPRAPRKSSKGSGSSTAADPYAVYKVLKGRGYDISVTADVLDPSAKPDVKAEKAIQPLIDILTSDGVELTTTSPKITFTIGLDEMMKLLKIQERK